LSDNIEDAAIERMAQAIYEIDPYIDSGESMDGFQVTPPGPVSWNSLFEIDEGFEALHKEQARAALAALAEGPLPASVMQQAVKQMLRARDEQGDSVLSIILSPRRPC
jgi:hypothetical protein